MGYFSNGTEGDIWAARNCERCILRERPCTILLAHELYNYDQHSEGEEKLKGALDALLPREERGGLTVTADCSMRVPNEGLTSVRLKAARGEALDGEEARSLDGSLRQTEHLLKVVQGFVVQIYDSVNEYQGSVLDALVAEGRTAGTLTGRKNRRSK